MGPRASVILTTYNQPRLLDLALRAYARQSCLDFEVIVADDGSGEETRSVVERHSAATPFRVVHVWQPDEGFRRAQAVNRAALRSRAPQLIFSDGHCLPSRTFVHEHLEAARTGTFVVGGHIRLTAEYTASLTPERVERGEFERQGPLRERLELWQTHAKSLFYIAIQRRRRPRLRGLNFSVDRRSFFRVNGFDQTYKQFGGEDSDLRNRMQLNGMRGRSIWHRARVFHLHHKGREAHLQRQGASEYYRRPDLAPEAPIGLRELAAEQPPD